MATLTNVGDHPLHVPGFNDTPLNFELPPEARFAHGLVDYRHAPRLTKTEMAMLRLMQSITEKSDWDTAILSPDELRLAAWHREVTQGPEGFLITPPVWDWCLAELADKARHWRATGRALILSAKGRECLSLYLGTSTLIALLSRFQFEFPTCQFDLSLYVRAC
ncbi:hypothetical protein BDW69DRAFT_189274 [Aspergillus filifer]